ncbi:Uncharacterized protein HZ326_4557 [Fusarium oxysporum f. sp. albedinis]|jgi:hypothetical protein|nr:Uncharacterized protein HZ326_4557 [Fusarium oxysporum f. sp. albedinis]
MCNSINLVLTKKPLNNMPTAIVLQDRIGRFSGLLRPTGDSISGRGQILELIAISAGSATGRDLKDTFEDRVLRRSRYHDGRPFHAIYDQYERWIDVSDDQSSELKPSSRCSSNTRIRFSVQQEIIKMEWYMSFSTFSGS